jgi:hypothetical protein
MSIHDTICVRTLVRTDVKTILLIPAKKEIEMAAISQREKKKEDEEKDGDSDRDSDAEDTADKATSNTALLNLSALSLLPTILILLICFIVMRGHC